MPDLPATSTTLLQRPLPAAPPPGTGRSARFRMLWAASILVPLAGFALAAWIAWNDVQTETRLRMLRTVDILHEHALRAIEVQENILAATGARIAGMDWPAIAGSEEVWRFANTITLGTPSVGLVLVAPDGQRVLDSRSPIFPTPPADLGGQDFVRAVRAAGAGTFIGAVADGLDGAPAHVSVAVPRIGPDGRPDGGVLASGLDPRFFTEFYRRFLQRPDDAVLLLRLDGALLAGLPTTLARHRPPDAVLPRTIRERGADGIAELVTASGVPRLITFRRLPRGDLAVVYGIDRGGITAAWYWRLWPIGLVFLAAAEALLALTWLTMRAVRRENAALALAAAQAAAARREAESRAVAESRLRRIEKLGALGGIAAGVAHDFNNIVNSMGTASRFMRDHAEDPARVRRLAQSMEETAERGARITRRMLDFARGAPESRETFQAGEAIESVCALLADTLPPDIALEWTVPENLPPVRGDRAEFETVIVNLVANGRDAMPGGGAILVRAWLAQGEHPRLHVSVADTGEGMAQDVLARAGEPFFTTKPLGSGTGLGLAMARRFAGQDRGGLSIESTPGQGTTVTLRLPVAPPEDGPAA